MREPEGYHDALAILNTSFPGTLVLTVEQIEKATLWSASTIKRRIKIVHGKASKMEVAKGVCREYG